MYYKSRSAAPMACVNLASCAPTLRSLASSARTLASCASSRAIDVAPAAAVAGAAASGWTYRTAQSFPSSRAARGASRGASRASGGALEHACRPGVPCSGDARPRSLQGCRDPWHAWQGELGGVERMIHAWTPCCMQPCIAWMGLGGEGGVRLRNHQGVPSDKLEFERSHLFIFDVSHKPP